jgi:hypothetical protein
MFRIFGSCALPLLGAAIVVAFISCCVKSRLNQSATNTDNDDETILLQTLAAPKRKKKAADRIADEVARYDSGREDGTHAPKHWGKGLVGQNLDAGCGYCSSYPSVIQLASKSTNHLMDTLTNIDTFISIAASLCARLELRPPCEMLSIDEFGKMQRQVSWKHLIDARFSDGSKCFISREELVWRDCDDTGYRLENGSSDGKANETCTTFKEIPTHGKYTRRFDMQYLLAAMSDKQPFRWRIEYDWKSIPANSNGEKEDIVKVFTRRSTYCKDHVVNPSKEIADAAQTFQRSLGLQSFEYNVLRVHRTSSKDQNACNTSVENVMAYVKCTLKEAKKEGRPIILFSDEPSAEYLAELAARLKDDLGTEVYPGDTVLKSALGTTAASLTHVRLLDAIITMKSRHHLLMDHTHCNSCDVLSATRSCATCSEDDCHACPFMEYVSRKQYHNVAMVDDDKDFGQEPACLQTHFEPKMPDATYGEPVVQP